MKETRSLWLSLQSTIEDLREARIRQPTHLPLTRMLHLGCDSDELSHLRKNESGAEVAMAVLGTFENNSLGVPAAWRIRTVMDLALKD